MTFTILEHLRDKAAECAGKVKLPGAEGEEWQRQADEWISMAAEIEAQNALAPLVPVLRWMRLG